MAKANPTRPNAPESEARLHDPRSVATIDTIGVDDPADLPDADLLDALDDQPADDGDHRSFSDDVRSDSHDDEKHERR